MLRAPPRPATSRDGYGAIAPPAVFGFGTRQCRGNGSRDGVRAGGRRCLRASARGRAPQLLGAGLDRPRGGGEAASRRPPAPREASPGGDRSIRRAQASLAASGPPPGRRRSAALRLRSRSRSSARLDRGHDRHPLGEAAIAARPSDTGDSGQRCVEPLRRPLDELGELVIALPSRPRAEHVPDSEHDQARDPHEPIPPASAARRPRRSPPSRPRRRRRPTRVGLPAFLIGPRRRAAAGSRRPLPEPRPSVRSKRVEFLARPLSLLRARSLPRPPTRSRAVPPPSASAGSRSSRGDARSCSSCSTASSVSPLGPLDRRDELVLAHLRAARERRWSPRDRAARPCCATRGRRSSCRSRAAFAAFLAAACDSARIRSAASTCRSAPSACSCASAASSSACRCAASAASRAASFASSASRLASAS